MSQSEYNMLPPYKLEYIIESPITYLLEERQECLKLVKSACSKSVLAVILIEIQSNAYLQFTIINILAMVGLITKQS